MSIRVVVLVAVSAIAAIGCGSSTPATTGATPGSSTPGPGTSGATSAPSGTGVGFTLTSPAFGAGQAIPVTFTCKGDNVSPPLAWDPIPAGTQSLALTMVDPDAPIPGGFTHWVAYGIGPSAGALGQGSKEALPGLNQAGKPGYTGPCPPAGAPHHYVFTLYALDQQVSFSVPPSRSEIEALGAHALATATLTGTFATS